MRKFKVVCLLLVVCLVALCLEAFVQQTKVIGRSSTLSPDGNWCLDLRLVEDSTLFASRRTLNANIKHSENSDWDVLTSIPFDDADAKTISNQNPDHPIVWSDDSASVTYWINDQLEDLIKIEANDEQHIFQRRLYATTVTNYVKTNGG